MKYIGCMNTTKKGDTMKTTTYKVKFENRFATLTEDEYKKLIAKGKKIIVLYKEVR